MELLFVAGWGAWRKAPLGRQVGINNFIIWQLSPIGADLRGIKSSYRNTCTSWCRASNYFHSLRIDF